MGAMDAVTTTKKPKPQIFGTDPFDGDLAMRGYALNDMCFSFNDEANREAFRADEEAYMAKYNLSEEQKEAVRQRNVLGMLDAGGNVYYLAKLAGIFGLNVQDLGSLQTGLSLEEFKQRLLDKGVTLRSGEMAKLGEAA